ncbi:MAG: GTPase Obg [Firmicutes bacterium]|nr:GTPase Obg [candidate division NPL-UPA2 bacterium]
MFVDSVTITVKSGSGGNGAATFRREKYVPQGGPSGGDGGKGGDVYVVADPESHTLMAYRFRKRFFAADGENGAYRNMHGHAGEDLVLKVAPGTVIIDVKTGRVLADLVSAGDRVLMFPGGRGGRGNAQFATAVRQAPNFAEKGRAGIEREIRLELKVIADVGLVGFPNAGKSTLLAAVSAARPRVADYPFTTLEPHLGVVYLDGRSFVMADIPGLIEGAHLGQGLGHAFLRHIERTRALIHVVDAAGTEGRDPLRDIEIINNELASYSSELAGRPQLLALNKVDAIPDRQLVELLVDKLTHAGYEVFPISAVSGAGMPALLHRAMDLVLSLPLPPVHVIESLPDSSDVVPLGVLKEGEVYIVSGTEVERLVSRVDLDNDDAVHRMQLALKRLGVFDLLRGAGVAEGSQVIIGNKQFSFYDDEPRKE